LISKEGNVSTGAIDRTEMAPKSAAMEPARSSRGVDVVCRALDVIGAVVGLVLLAPAMLIIAIAIRLESPGPVVFRQRRVGRSLKPFTVCKFRTMRRGASTEVHKQFVLGLIAGDQPTDAEGRPRFKLSADDRVTRVGRILRRSSIDELPQLWNVLRGDMSLVGPRPPIQYEVDEYPLHWFARFAVKPGITGLWQVNGRSELPLEQMVELDIEYARRRSLLLNVWILLRTVPAVMSGRGAS
jgi:lipopolysaccharide/colanic/teichoic acid biosynthesis glycosyltransferase